MVQAKRLVNLGANILTLTWLHSELLHGKNLETSEPKSYYTDSNLASLGATTSHKPRGM